MNDNQWFNQHIHLCGVFAPETDQQIDDALRAAPYAVTEAVRQKDDWRAAWTQGAQTSFWRRSFAGQVVPESLTDTYGIQWTRNTDGHLAPLMEPAPEDCEIDTPEKLYIWMSGYVYALRISTTV